MQENKILPIVLALLPLTAVIFSPTYAAPTGEMCNNLQKKSCFCMPESKESVNIRCNFTTSQTMPLLNTTANTHIAIDLLDLSGNNLSSLPEDFFQGVSTVLVLSLGNNKFSQIPSAILTLEHLENLDLSGNVLESVSFQLLANISGLKTMNFSKNYLTQLSENTTALDFEHMTELDVSSNFIKSIDGNLFASMTRLSILDLSNNRLVQVEENMFPSLKYSLTALNLSHNSIQSIQPLTLQHLRHLHKLDLSHNINLTHVTDLQFPSHLTSLDLSYCALSNISYCGVSQLLDLVDLRLEGNHLQCSCQLHMLQTWYLNQQQTVGNASFNSNWTCVLMDSATKTSTIGSSTLNQSVTSLTHHNSLESTQVPGIVIMVANLSDCVDIKNHCPSLEISTHQPKVRLELNVAASDGNIMASWTVESENIEVDGFFVNYVPEGNDEIKSPQLPADQRSYIFVPEELEKHYRVCVEALVYNSIKIQSECEVFTGEGNSNTVVGILAGVVFIVPCIIAVIYIVIRDYQVGKNGYYTSIDSKDEKDMMKESAEEVSGLTSVVTDTPKVALASAVTEVPKVQRSTEPAPTTLHAQSATADSNSLKSAAESTSISEQFAIKDELNSEPVEDMKQAEHCSEKMQSSGKGVDNPCFNHSEECTDPGRESTSL